MTDEAEDRQPVIFRKFKDGDVIAILPHQPGTNDPKTCGSYMHVGQHGSCEPIGLIWETYLAAPSEYADLLKELEGMGYRFYICKRYRFDWIDVRRKQLEAIK